MSEQVIEMTEKKEGGPFSIRYPGGPDCGPVLWCGHRGMNLQNAEWNAKNIVAWLNKVWVERMEKDG